MSARVVLDASAALRLALRGPHAELFLAQLGAAATVLAPKLYCSEVANAVWKYLRAGTLDGAEGIERLNDAMALVDDFEPDEALAVEALAAAVEYRHPVYDFMYLVTARRHAATLLTADRKLADLARLLGISVICDSD